VLASAIAWGFLVKDQRDAQPGVLEHELLQPVGECRHSQRAGTLGMVGSRHRLAGTAELSQSIPEQTFRLREVQLSVGVNKELRLRYRIAAMLPGGL